VTMSVHQWLKNDSLGVFCGLGAVPSVAFAKDGKKVISISFRASWLPN
jgi:hypothetical protein